MQAAPQETFAHAAGLQSSPKRERESYVPANVSGKCRQLVFPGPRMQVCHTLIVGRRSYVLKGTFAIDLELHSDGTVFATHRTLPVHSYGESMLAAISAFCMAFDMQWRGLVEVDKDALTDGALRARRQLKAAVERVVDDGEPGA